MTKTELIAAIAGKRDISLAAAGIELEVVLDTIRDAMKAEGEVRITGFGIFATRRRAASEGRNPRTMEPIQIPEKVVVGFRAGKDLQRALNS